ncbi:hypothetical protein [Natronosalvus caseinilyticus]|uniref:hypothetical protein n=1 Tax=Natronosalvus caseinilyticus TaxID=2953747 RepID=UPI0028B175FE|nr:hypothetical protein [Natronosalvus caseinilyticus]
MSSNADEEVPGREVAYRVFAAEFDDADYSHAESDEERAPNYVITPTGARLNRVFVVGALTEVTAVNDEMLRARVVDPTGAFVVYAGQYQPDELAFLERIDPPAFVAVTGKARTFQPDDSDVVYTSIRPESIATVDPETRDRWVVSAAEQTLERAGTYAAAADLEASGDALEAALREAGVERGLAAGIPLAQGHYGTTPAYLEGVRDLALDAAAVVAGDRDEVRGLDRQPSDSQPGAPSFAALASAESVDLDVDVDGDADLESDPADEGSELEAPAAAEATAAAGTAEAEDGTESADLEADGADDASGDDELGDFDAGESDSTGDELGDFDAGAEAEAETEAATAEESGSTADEDPVDEESVDVGQNGDLEEDELEDASGMYEMDDEEREQLEAEFGTEFSTGADVDEPGEADIDVPTGDESVEDVEDAEDAEAEPALDEEESTEEAEEGDEIDESGGEEESEEADEDDGDEEGDDEETDLEDVDLQNLVVETMTDLDDGEGADRSAVIDTVTDETGADEDDVEEAIDDALMGGECYEPGDGKLKAI